MLQPEKAYHRLVSQWCAPAEKRMLETRHKERLFANQHWLSKGGSVLSDSEFTHALCVTDGTTVQAGKLQPGDQILRREGEEVIAVRVLSVTPTDRTEKVFNLILGNSEIFVANGFLARSKPPKSGQKVGADFVASEK